MENIGPVVLFLLYMVISAWAKQKKNREIEQRKEKYLDEEAEPTPLPGTKVESFFDQLKRELFEEEEVQTPPFMKVVTPEPEYLEELEAIPVQEPMPEDMPFSEGSQAQDIRDVKATDFRSGGQEQASLREILEPFPTIQQGIILHEILGKPRALQPDKEWFHSH